MSAARGIVFALAAVCSVASLLSTAQAEPLRIRYAVWPGYGPLFFAREKDWFEKEDIEIELIEMEEHTAAFAALAAGQVDAILGAPPDAASFSQPGEEPLACVLVTGESFGGDGVLATTDIDSIADLKGKSVAFLRGSLSQYYINVLLNDVGLTEADIEVVDLAAEDAVTALQLQEVDAAVTWQPWLSQGKAVEHVHLLTDSSQRPGLLVDCLITTASVFQDRKAEFQALARIWFEAKDYVGTHPEEAVPIMARHLGGGQDDPAAFARSLETIRFFDRERHRAYFGTPENPGPIYQAAQHAIDVFSDLGVLTFRLSPSGLVIHGILEE
jgi:NitT/TauT family transport system substrate-binding protein